MRLKKLQLLGFKTFADKTEIEIGDGLTAIVGPNGSGKSNLVDALLWALGEQNPRILRGVSPQDVIFAGTDRRKPMGMAEVRLTVDNSDGKLAIKFSEVTILRRIYRSGESQYQLNGSPCRLKDIVELFMDTGMGKGAYAVVGQQDIDAVLSAKPEDRRLLFEEAAGIKKYRSKKQEALRRLEAAEENLQRVRDILNDLESRRLPLENQATLARRYLLLQERLREIEVGLLTSELQKADYDQKLALQAQQEDQAALLSLETTLAELNLRRQQLHQRLEELERDLEEARTAGHSAQSEQDRLQNRLALLHERETTAGQRRQLLTDELESIAARLQEAKVEIEACIAERADLETNEATLRQNWETRKTKLREMEVKLQSLLQRAEKVQRDRLLRVQERARREAAIQANLERGTELNGRITRLEEERHSLNQQLEAQRQRHVEQQAKRNELVLQEQTLQQKRTALEEQQRSDQKSVAELWTKMEQARRELATHSARLASLVELQESYEGYFQGVRSTLAANKQGRLPGHYRTVVDLLKVPEAYRLAIEIALGSSLQDIVTQTEQEAKDAIEWLKANRAGRATFLALPLLRPAPVVEIPRNATNVERALDVVGFEGEYTVAIELLLGRTLITPQMEEAISASRRQSGWNRIVTQEGELITPGGALTGGSQQGRGAQLVGRKGEIDDLRASTPRLQTHVDELAAQIHQYTAQVQHIETQREAMAKDAATVGSEKARIEAELNAMEQESLRLERTLSERSSAYQNLLAQQETLRLEMERLNQQNLNDIAEDSTSDDAQNELQSEIRSLATERDEARTATVALEVEVSRMREKQEGLSRNLQSQRTAVHNLEAQRKSRSDQLQSLDSEGTVIVEERNRLQATLEDFEKQTRNWSKKVAEINALRQTLSVQRSEAEQQRRENEILREEAAKRLHAVEVRLAKLEMQISTASQRLEQEYGILMDAALNAETHTPVDRATSIEVGRLQREIRGMGNVNTGAVEEYERLVDRIEFLSTQETDLKVGQESLLATIKEIDENTRDLFLDTFEAVGKEFQRLFCTLFEGGSAKLSLTTPEDILETGIEIVAEPPGKKPQRLSLLSGGEKALTAAALLFAFLVVRPSPFVLLDEVDAPLDGANVEKFVRLVHEFSKNSQFLLITHNPTTMEAAPFWYGVSMKEPGVSAILSYRVPQEETTPSGGEAKTLIQSVQK